MFIRATLEIPQLLFVVRAAWRLSWETAQLMYSWCMNCEWCTARQLLYCTYLRSLVYAWTYIYGTSKIRLSLRKIQFHTVDVIIRNVAIQGIFSLDLASFWCRIVSIVDSLCNNHQRSLLDLRQLLPGHLLRQPRTTTPVSLMKKNAFVTPSSYSLGWVRFVATAAVWMSILRMNLVRTEQGTEARYLLALTWTHFDPHVFPGLTLTSVTAVHSIRLFADDYSILER